jgi:hypothetical protein
VYPIYVGAPIVAKYQMALVKPAPTNAARRSAPTAGSAHPGSRLLHHNQFGGKGAVERAAQQPMGQDALVVGLEAQRP